MSSSELILALSIVIPALSLCYAAYWALDIRKALRVRLYRNQAFGLAVFSLVLILALIPSPEPGINENFVSSLFVVVYFLLTSIFWLGVVNFVDATAQVSRRADPLLRDTIHWSKVRYVFWIIQIFNVSFILLALTFSYAFANPALLNQIILGNNGVSIRSSLPAFITNLAWAVSFVSLVVFVPIATRAKDPLLRNHIKWLAITAGVLFVVLVIFSGLIPSGFYSLVVTAIGFVLVGYCLYRSARALVPINKISAIES
jgi:magnesium-transporting ATPase (P-type)